MSVSFVIVRFVIGGLDDEMALCRLLIDRAIASGLEAEVVEAAPGQPRGDAQYVSPLNPRRGDVWIECAPADGGREEVDTSFCCRIDHHQTGDSGYGRPAEEAFEASSLGQLLRLLLEQGVSPYDLGLWDLDDPTINSFAPGFSYAGGPYGYGWGVHIPEGAARGAPGFHWFKAPQEWVLTGAVDHDPVAACRGGRWGSPGEVRAFLVARAAASGRGFTIGDVEEAVRLILAAPTLPGYPTVLDLRAIPELCPATLGPDRQPVPGTGGRLGAAAYQAVITCLPGRAAINWGAQGERPQGRHLGLIGDTAALDGPEILRSAGAVGVYGAPGKAAGGYIPA